MRLAVGGEAAPARRRILAASVSPIGGPASGARIIRTSLSDAELAQPMTISVSLRMRNFAGLQARLDRGQNLANGGISGAEMEGLYLPSASDYSETRDWLVSQGLAVTTDDSNHTTVFASGTVSRVAAAFGVPFARVATADGEFTSSVGAPSLPDSLPSSVLGVDGLQPHIRAHHPAAGLAQALGNPSTGLYVAPSDVMDAYAFPPGLTGSGQTIAIIMAANISPSDLTLFWNVAGVPQSIANFTAIPVAGGPDADSQSGLALEVAIDVDWASATAPGAKVRLYAIPDLLFATINEACVQILGDAKTNPGLSVVSMSIAGPENQLPIASYEGYSQTFAQLAAAGITVLACSGDGGSNPNPNLTNGYSPLFALGPEYPASDPNVAGVGGTNLTFTDSWTYADEPAWSNIPSGGPVQGQIYLATGGGVSMFARPPWQADGGAVLASFPASRCVPDVAAISIGTAMATNPASVALSAIVLNGTLTGCYGTSLATPIWAGIIAAVNQARASNNLGPIGLLGPAIYPLHGTKAFNDITTGTNGAYRAGPGYDLCTGLGSPNVANLVRALAGAGSVSGTPPSGTITAAVPPSPVDAGAAMAIAASASGSGTLTYQWYLDGVAISGARGPTYGIAVGAADAGTYSVTITGAGGSTTLGAGTLSVTTNAWLTNLSARALVEAGSNILIAGFVTAGPARKSILIRGAGPALGSFGIPNVLPSPVLSLVDSLGSVLRMNSAWDAGLSSTFSSLGAFAFQAGSNDTAILAGLPAGAYTAQVSSADSQDGVAIAEVYDADATAPASRLVNLSARAFVGTGANILIGGFVIAGTTSETVVVRGVGPALAEFGLNAVLSNPVLSVYDSRGSLVARDAGWSNAVSSSGAAAENATPYTFSRVSAFALEAGSADSAMVLTLPPGQYTAQLTAAAGSVAASGIGLVEVYEMR